MGNHFGGVYCCSTLYRAGFEEQEVTERSGHRSCAVRTYKRASDEQEKEISNVLQPPAPKYQCCIESVSNPGKTTSSTLTPRTNKGESGNVLRMTILSCINTIVINNDCKDIILSI